jgi:serine/threonine protein kinase
LFFFAFFLSFFKPLLFLLPRNIIQVFSALSYLHHNNIVHRDIKSDNIAVSSHVLGVGGLTADNVVAQIIDFGMGRVLIEEEHDPDPEEIQQHEQESLEYKRTSGLDDCEPEPESPVGLADEPLYRRCTSSESSPMCVAKPCSARCHHLIPCFAYF